LLRPVEKAIAFNSDRRGQRDFHLRSTPLGITEVSGLLTSDF
jgi:hypothetical protein